MLVINTTGAALLAQRRNSAYISFGDRSIAAKTAQLLAVCLVFDIAALYWFAQASCYEPCSPPALMRRVKFLM